MRDQESACLPHVRDYLPAQFLQRMTEAELDELNQLITVSGVLICNDFPEECLDSSNLGICRYIRLVSAFLGDRHDPKSLEGLRSARAMLNKQ